MALIWADLDADYKYPDWLNADVKAAGCGLYLCVKEFYTLVTDGQLKEKTKEVDWTRLPESYQVIDDSTKSKSVHGNLHDLDLGKTKRTDLLLGIPRKSSNMFAMTQAGVCGLIEYISKAFDDGTLWFTEPNLKDKTIDRAQVVGGISGMVRLLPNTHNFQYTPDVMEIFWNQRGMEN
jgi:hypothetical protein